MKNTVGMAAVALLVWAASAAGQSGEFVETTVTRLGYAVIIPREFSLDGAVSGTTAWVYQPASPDAGPDEGGQMEPPLTIWINRVPVETKNLVGLYEIGRRYDADSAAAPEPTIRALAGLAVEGGYAYWYKEVDKADPAAGHRWIARVFGNGAVYTIAVSGPFGEFEAWGPAFGQVIAGFRLVPMK